MAGKSKAQITAAKRAREQAVKERRALKLERKQAASAAKRETKPTEESTPHPSP